ncbi:hypothetical protein EXN66_Car009171 [Channa argus]|uniref:Uncharacterized protein n=1 Tax=Channa argus TaxID=215402 RepID=A0A6G1PTA5_CHAAH|nr:hypothetical protein EXN66_Car009171 [Channa argus]
MYCKKTKVHAVYSFHERCLGTNTKLLSRLNADLAPLWPQLSLGERWGTSWSSRFFF